RVREHLVRRDAGGGRGLSFELRPHPGRGWLHPGRCWGEGRRHRDGESAHAPRGERPVGRPPGRHGHRWPARPVTNHLAGGSRGRRRRATEVVTEDANLALIAYTAGTTAAPRGAMLSHGNLRANLEQMSGVRDLAMTSKDVVLLALPLFHIYALNAILGLAVKSGASAILIDRFDARESLEVVAVLHITALFGVPLM